MRNIIVCPKPKAADKPCPQLQPSLPKPEKQVVLTTSTKPQI